MNTQSQRADSAAPWALRPVITLAGPPAGSDARQVQAPDRVLRVWALLRATDGELHDAAQLPSAMPVLQRSLRAARAELERSVSAPLAAELHHLLHVGPAAPGACDLRIECASLLGWTIGLVAEMLSQIEAAAAAIAPSRPTAASAASSLRSASSPLAAADGNLPDDRPKPSGHSPMVPFPRDFRLSLAFWTAAHAGNDSSRVRFSRRP